MTNSNAGKESPLSLDQQPPAKPRIAFILTCLTLLFIAWQIIFFIIHFSLDGLIDAMSDASIVAQIYYPPVLVPIFIYLLCMVVAYFLFTGWIWFITRSLGETYQLTPRATSWLGIFFWFTATLGLLAINHYYFPASFFSTLVQDAGLIPAGSTWLLTTCSVVLIAGTITAYYHFFQTGHFRKMGITLLAAAGLATLLSIHDNYLVSPVRQPVMTAANQPNIIIIGMDSLRPDFTHYFGNKIIHTPNIDAFLSSGLTFTENYTGLARTFPSWISILTGKHPVHSGARNNLINPTIPLAQDNLAKHLHQAGYATVYASDEKRYSNITKNYGFDQLIGPSMGANDFVLGSIGDSPISNLLTTSAIGRLLLPYNYANRAAATTYYPAQFMQQIKIGLQNRPNKPLFLSVHFCLSHWPYTWANDLQSSKDILPTQYLHSVEGVDKQLGELLQMLKANGLLQNSLVVLLSDHGTALGLAGDRIVSPESYHGERSKIKFLPVTRYSNTPRNSLNLKDFSINTSYGQGTTVLSLVQNHTLLSFKRYGGELPARNQNGYTNHTDIAPTILDYLHLPPLEKIDGVSLTPYFSSTPVKPLAARATFLETGDSFCEIETDHIKVGKVLKREIGIYEIDPKTGLLQMIKPASDAVARNKELAIIKGEWLLAHFPENHSIHMVISKKNPRVFEAEAHVIKPFFVVYNLKTKQWTIGLDTPFAKQSPAQKLLAELRSYFPGEVPLN